MSASDSRIAVPSDRQIALWLGACFAVVYVGFADGFFKGSDEVGVFQTALALGVEGRLDVPPLMHTFPGRDGRIYSHFALGQSVLALPLIAAARVTGAALPAAWVDALAGPVVEHRGHRFGGSLEIAATTLYAPLASGLLIALFFVFERRLGVSQRNALLASALLGGTTYAAFMSGYFLRHTTEAITILGGFLGAAEYRRTGSLRALALGSGMASLTLLIRVPAILFAPGLAAYLLWVVIERARAGGLAGPARTAAAITAPAAAVFAVHTGLNFWRWEMWIGSPMLAQVGLLDGSLVEGVAGLLVSPFSSLFLYSPLLLLAPLTLRAFARRHAAECVAVLGVAATFLLVCGSFQAWHGLWSAPGPRYLFPLLPLLFLSVGVWLDQGPSLPGRVALAGLAALGAGIQLAMLVVDWRSVALFMGYGDGIPDLFVWNDGPLIGYARYFFSGPGQWTFWLGNVASGWQRGGSAGGMPGLALGLGIVWAGVLAFCALRLWTCARSCLRRA